MLLGLFSNLKSHLIPFCSVVTSTNEIIFRPYGNHEQFLRSLGEISNKTLHKFRARYGSSDFLFSVLVIFIVCEESRHRRLSNATASVSTCQEIPLTMVFWILQLPLELHFCDL